MDISVIVVTYNQEGTIARTLDSILAQRTDAEFEIIIGDDSSSDGTEAICRRYAAAFPRKIVYLRRESNMGVVRNYFDCIAHSHGRYLADCAGDDFWVDDSKLQRQFETLEKDREVSLVATDWLCCDETGADVRRYPGIPAPEGTEIFERERLCAPLLSQEKMIHLCSALYRKDLLAAQIESYPDIFINPAYTCEDQQILLAMASSGRIVILPQVTLHYTVGHESVSHRRSAENRFDYSLAALRQTLILQDHFHVSREAMSGLYTDTATHLAAMAFRTGAPERRSRLKSLLRETGIALARKGKLYMFLSSCPLIWKMARPIVSALRRSRE